MHHEKVHTTFWYMGRASIIIPIVVIALALIFKIDQYKKEKQNPPLPRPVPTAQKSNTLSTNPIIPSKTNPIDLSVPQKCVFTNASNDSGVVYTDTNNIYGEFSKTATGLTTKVLIKGDCVYKWDSSATVGEQICGVEQYLSILKSLASTGLLDASTLISIVNSTGGGSEEKIETTKFETTCTPQPVPETIFVIDPSVTFTKRTAGQPSPGR